MPRALAVVLASSAVLVAGCSSKKSAPAGDPMAERALGLSAAPGEVRTINTVCPIGGHEFNAVNHTPALVREHNGQKIGFCCDGCSESWDSMAEAEREKVYNLARANKSGQ